jgi:hypothetical protein
MADYFYAVDISRDEKLARTPSYVDRFLVELVCEDHRTEDNYESDREHSASEIALDATLRLGGNRRHRVQASKSIWRQDSSESRRSPI